MRTAGLARAGRRAGIARSRCVPASRFVALALTLACARASFSPETAETHITTSLQSWFTALARSAPGGDAATPLAKPPGVERLAFSLSERSALPADALPAWREALRTPHLRVEYRLAGLEISEGGEASYRVRFALERRAISKSGLTHVARTEEKWSIRAKPGSTPIVTEIATEPRLAFPGTGPQIVCY